jgi:hypothetical protein
MQLVIEQPHLIESLGKRGRGRALAYYTLQRLVLQYRDLLRAQ